MTTTTTFNYTGSVQQWAVPPGVTSIDVDLRGAIGGGSGTDANGGRVQGTLAVTPGQILNIYCGGAGSIPSGQVGALGGFNGGGTGGSTGSGGLGGCSGGGASDIRVGGTALANRVAVAGGGGGDGRGAGQGGRGGAATGQAGTAGGGTETGGGGGTQAAGGAAGTSTGQSASATAGSSGQGGFGSSNNATNGRAGGGGGGGYFGGGGGGSHTTNTSSGGGGASNFVGTLTGVSSTQGSALANGNGLVALTYNQAPNPPGLVSPANGSHTDRTQATVFQWNFSDSDIGDTQSAADFRYQDVASPGWITTTTAVSGTTNTFSIAGSTFTDAHQYEWQVQTYDNAGLPSGWSVSSFFTAHALPTTPVVTAPAGTITANPVPVSWNIAGSQVAYQIQIVADNGAGVADMTTVYSDSAQVNSSSHASVPRALGSAPQGGHVHVMVRYQQFAGVWSAWGDSGNLTVNVGPPGIPTVALSPSPATGAMLVTITNPGTPNPTTSQDLYRTNADEVPMRLDYSAYTKIPTTMDTLQPVWPYTPGGASTQTILNGMRGLNFASAGAQEEWQFWAAGRKINRIRAEFQFIGAGATDGESVTLGAFTIFKSSATVPDSHGYLVMTRTTWSFNVCQAGAVTQLLSGSYTSLPLNTTLMAEIVTDPVNNIATLYLPDGSNATITNTAIGQVLGTYLGSGTAVAAGNTDKKVYVMNVWGTDGSDFGEQRISFGLGANASFIDYTPASGVKYRYRVQAFAGFGGTASSL